MTRTSHILRNSVFVLWASVALCAFAARANAQPQITAEAQASKSILIQVGETRLLRLSDKVIRVSVADPNVSDVQVVTERQVLITAKAVGNTHLILWGTTNEPLVVSITSVRNLDQLRTQLKTLFPTENVEVGAAGDLLVLSGNVSDLRVPARMAEVAKLYSEKLANLVEVSGDQQVQLDVRFAEVSRTGLRKIGVNFFWKDVARNYIGGTSTNSTLTGSYLDDPNGLFVPGTAGGAPPEVSAPSAGDAFNLFFSAGLSKFPFSAILSILSQEGLARVLAEPTLVALSGQQAKFHAGGEIPILIARQLGEVSVQFKKFGVVLGFTPTVLGNGTVSLKLAAEVSEPDASAGVNLGGFTVPGFRTRSSETTVRLKDGQSFAVAGLLSDNVRSTVSKIPLLGDLPILGALFRSTAFQREETELLVVVKATLVRPLDPDEVPLMPGEDELNDPSDFDLFLLGRTSTTKDDADTRAPSASADSDSAPSVSATAGPTGPIGFVRQ